MRFFIAALFVNGAAGGFTADLLISSFAFWVFLFAQKAPRIPIYIALNLTIGLSCALPLYFYFRAVDEEREEHAGWLFYPHGELIRLQGARSPQQCR